MRFKDSTYGDLSGQVYNGNIDISDMGISSLEGSPMVVEGDFNCSWNDLTTLEDGPKFVTGKYDCSNNMLTSLESSPVYLKDSIDCSHNMIKSLDQLSKNITNEIRCTHNVLSDLKGCPGTINVLDCSFNRLTNFRYGPIVNKKLIFEGNNLEVSPYNIELGEDCEVIGYLNPIHIK